MVKLSLPKAAFSACNRLRQASGPKARGICSGGNSQKGPIKVLTELARHAIVALNKHGATQRDKPNPAP